MRKSITAFSMLFLLLGFVQTNASELSLHEKDEIKKLAIEAILENPQIVEDALRRLQELREEEKIASIRTTIESRRDDLERDPNAPVLGNPDGDVTLVEFFDYNCGFCKRAMQTVRDILEKDTQVRLVYREWPILGEGSLFGARAALAARKQNKYEEFHWALMSTPQVTESSTLKVAGEIGLDVEQLQRDMALPEVDQHIALSMELANGLGITGTPTFFTGDELAPGFIPFDKMEQMIARAREIKSK